MLTPKLIIFSREEKNEFFDSLKNQHNKFNETNLLFVKTIDELDLFLKSENSVFLIVIGRDLNNHEKEKAIQMGYMYKITLGIIPGVYECILSGKKLKVIRGIPLYVIKPFSYKNFLGQFFQKFFAMALLIVLFPLIMIIGFIVKLDSPGSVFYRQERVGREGKTFILWKFRTMIEGAEVETGPVFCKKNDTRITRVGKILRLSHLDEIPQLWNIVKGEMNWVGPRPERPVFVHQFEKSISGYFLRHLVKPGLTGAAQVYIRYDSSPQDKLLFDLQHLVHPGFFENIKIILATVPKLFGRKGR